MNNPVKKRNIKFKKYNDNEITSKSVEKVKDYNK